MNDTFQDIINSQKPVLIDFYGAWCGPCQNKDFLKAYHVLKEQFVDNPDVLFLELDVDENEELVNDFNIRSIPTFKIFNKGKLLNEYMGAGNLEKVYLDIKTIVNNL